jgi:DNA-binding beta-propeller fold protein YncE
LERRAVTARAVPRVPIIVGVVAVVLILAAGGVVWVRVGKGTNPAGPVPAVAGSMVSIPGEIDTLHETFLDPRGIVVSPDGAIYVADAGRRAVVMVAPDRVTTRLLGENSFVEPVAVALSGDGGLLVVDADPSVVWKLDPISGQIIGQVDPEERLFHPRGIAVSDDGRIAITDTGNNRIVLLAPDGTPSAAIPGVTQPTDVVFMSDGNLLVAETGAAQIVLMRSSGERIGAWAMPPANTVFGPHIARLPNGGWVVTSPETHTLLYRASERSEVQSWATDPSLKKPVGVAAYPGGIIVGDATAGTVTAFSLP